MTRIIHVLAFDNAQVLDVTGPLQVFASTNDLARQRGLPLPYAASVIAAQTTPVMTSAGLALLAEPLPAADTPCDTLVIAGGWGVYGAAEDAELVAWVKQKAQHTRRMASVCTGAFLLAASGLLDGCRVATHWTRCEELARKYPLLTVESNPIFIQQGAVWTSAGVTAGIDLCLALVEEDLGRAVALEVARHLVVFLKRPGGPIPIQRGLVPAKRRHSLRRFARLDRRKPQPRSEHSHTGCPGGHERTQFRTPLSR